jgi:hypothetical protein
MPIAKNNLLISLITRGKSEIISRGFQWSSNHASLFLSTGTIFSRMKIWWLCVGVIVGLGFARLMAESPAPRRDINAVLAAHDRQLLDLPAVVGVYVGVLADGKTPCLKVMLARPTPETERKIPREIEGYPVVTEISGEIRPLRP